MYHRIPGSEREATSRPLLEVKPNGSFPTFASFLKKRTVFGTCDERKGDALVPSSEHGFYLLCGIQALKSKSNDVSMMLSKAWGLGLIFCNAQVFCNLEVKQHYSSINNMSLFFAKPALPTLTFALLLTQCP